MIYKILQQKTMSVKLAEKPYKIDMREYKPLNCENQSIIHNGKKYSAPIKRFLINSDFYLTTFAKNKNKEIILNDLHSEKAFDAFIDLINGKNINFSKISANEILSILKEWKCDRILKFFDNFIHDKGMHPKRIHVKTLSGQVLLLHIKEKDTINSIKQILKNETNIEPEKQVFIYNGQNITENLSYESFSNDDILYMVKQPIKTIDLYFKGVSGSHFCLKMYAHSKISEIQAIISKKVSMPAEEIGLLYNGISLEPEKTLTDYNIKKDSTINIIPIQYSEI